MGAVKYFSARELTLARSRNSFGAGGGDGVRTVFSLGIIKGLELCVNAAGKAISLTIFQKKECGPKSI